MRASRRIRRGSGVLAGRGRRTVSIAPVAAAALIVLAAAAFPAQEAAAQGAGIMTVNTPRDSYSGGDAIVVSGDVSAIIADTPVILQVFYNDTILVEVTQLDVAQDGTYTHIISAAGPLWDNDGEYTVRALYSVDNAVETTFDFVATRESASSSAMYEVGAGSSGTFDVEYTVVDGAVHSMRVDPRMFGMTVFLEEQPGGGSGSGGSITLTLPREYIDARTDGCGGGDEFFIMLVDGIETPYERVSDMSDKRIVTVPFPEGAMRVEVIGTCVVPEFGGAAAVAVAAAAMGAAVAARGRGAWAAPFPR